MKLLEFVVGFIGRQGVRHVFALPGGQAMDMEFFAYQAPFSCVIHRHEQACAIAAETYAKVSGNLGVAVVSTGAGGTNALTGLVGAWLDSTPCLFISGQVSCAELKGHSGVRQLGAHEVDIVSMVASVTKYAVTVTDPQTIRYHLEKAVHLATQGRPAPVWIDLPRDVQEAIVEPERLPGFDPTALPPVTGRTELAPAMSKVIDLLSAAKRPILLFGNGVRLARAERELHEFVARFGIPTMATWLAVDMMAYDDPLYVGKPGTVAARGVNFALQNADFLLVVGSRLDLTITAFAPARLAREAVKIMVDIDPAELEKLAPYIDVPICADAGDFLRAMLLQEVAARRQDWSSWLARCSEWKTKYPVVLPEHRRPDQLVSVYFLGDVLSEEMAGDQLIVSGSSGAGIEVFQHVLRLQGGQRLLHTTALGAMGYGLPAAIGACLAGAGRPTILVEGDGSMQLNIQELETLRRLNLPIKILILNNNGYSSIRTSQTRWFGQVFGADPASGMTLPNIVKLAEAYGLPTARIADQRNLRAELRAVLATPGPVVCEVVCLPDEARMPSIASAQRPDGSMVSKPLEDLWPFLDRDEFLANMIIPPLEQ